MEIAEDQRLKGPWHYDLVWNALKKKSEEAQRLFEISERDIRKIDKLNRKGQRSATTLLGLKRTRERIFREQRNLDIQRKSMRMDFEKINRSHPFLIGPATLESLFEDVPEKFEYLEHGKIPFNDLFFDFVRPIEYPIPFVNRTGSFFAASLHRVSTIPNIPEDENLINTLKARPVYQAYFYEAHPIHPFALPLTYNFSVVSLRFKNGNISPPTLRIVARVHGTKKGIDTVCEIFPEADIMKKVDCLGEDFIENENIYSLDPKDMTVSSFRDLRNYGLLSQVPNFCVNLINYINSHNVQINKRTRGKRTPRSESETLILSAEQKPFSLITVRDSKIEETTERETRTWDLNWRVYVRGHVRHYRDEEGNLTSTTWVHPYVRGPTNAPWKTQRYEILAKKLEEERRMYQEHNL